jgi:t-SNARE complex subunit (syntaxin)
MSHLIQSQGETLMKIEDDVEAAMDHVEAGREEIIKLYEWTKGNRGLIIKVFSLLIFFIVFMRFYG